MFFPLRLHQPFYTQAIIAGIAITETRKCHMISVILAWRCRRVALTLGYLLTIFLKILPKEFIERKSLRVPG